MTRERVKLGPDQELVWEYPRPPRIEKSSKRIRTLFNNVVIAQSDRAKRVLETSHPPVYYIPRDDVKLQYLHPTERASLCEWKGLATYFAVKVGEREADRAAWTYRCPPPEFEAIKDHIAFYPSKMDACFVADEMVEAQPGDFYGGWITKDIDGPFKGGAGTQGW